MRKKGLIILHIDGLSYARLMRAIQKGYMPFVDRLVKEENYIIQKYRTSLPSTTPFAQAGMLYGDTKEIPSFRWWDKESGVLVKFGARGSFGVVAHKYFKHRIALTQDGACIAACFTGNAIESFTIGFKAPDGLKLEKQRSIFRTWIRNPIRVFDWFYSSLIVIVKYTVEYIRAHMQSKKVSTKYFLANMLYEIFFHHLTRFAVSISMRRSFPTIYAAIYAYDEATHAFGPDDYFTYRILRQVDESIYYISQRRNRKRRGQNVDYEILILSDHGQVETIPFTKIAGKRFGEIVSDLLPSYKIIEESGITIIPKSGIDGEIIITYSGGLAHFYFKTHSWRLNYSEINKKYPQFLINLAKNEEIAFLMVREGNKTIVIDSKNILPVTKQNTAKITKLLKKYDDPDILLPQLEFLNSFERSGDIVIFGNYIENRQINFENQSGGHGSIGGEQMYPFIMGKKDWNIEAQTLTTPIHLHKLLTNLKKHIVTSE